MIGRLSVWVFSVTLATLAPPASLMAFGDVAVSVWRSVTWRCPSLPKGFERDDDGYLHVLLDPDQDAGEVGYLEVRRALERVESGESYRAVARGLPNLTRPTLMNIHKDPDRRRWYLETEATDERVNAALESVR